MTFIILKTLIKYSENFQPQMPELQFLETLDSLDSKFFSVSVIKKMTLVSAKPI